MQAKKQQLEWNMEQWTDSTLEKEYIEVVYCHPAYLTFMWNTSCEMPGISNESRAGIKIARRNITNSRYEDDPILKQKAKRN